jgi:hypothetical protein
MQILGGRKKPKSHDHNYGKVVTPEEARMEMKEQKEDFMKTDEAIDELTKATELRTVRKNDTGDRKDADHLVKILDDDDAKERLILQIVDN